MADGIPSHIDDTVSSVIKLDLSHLWDRHRGLQRNFERHVDDEAALRLRLLKDDTEFRTEVWRRVGHLENLKWYVSGAAAVVSAVMFLIWAYGSEIAQMRITKVVQAQSSADRRYLDSKFETYEKALRELQENYSRPEDHPPAEQVRRRR